MISQEWLSQFEINKPSGEIPNDFLLDNIEKAHFQKNEDQLDANQKSNKYYLESSYAVNELLKNGKILFNDPMSSYVTGVAHKLLINEPKLKEKLRFYIFKSSVINAFATADGMIFISTGLLAKLNFESQLAFVLCHEMVHYINQHSYKDYKREEQISQNDRQLNVKASKSRLLAKSLYSQKQETEADIEGFIMFRKSEYSTDKIPDIFLLLDSYYLPFRIDYELDQNDLDPNMVLTQFKYKDSCVPFVPIDPTLDEFHSHPHTKERILVLGNRIKNDTRVNSPEFLISETTFFQIRKMARFELINELLSDRKYYEAIVCGLQLEKEFGSNKFINICIAKGLYGIHNYKMNGWIRLLGQSQDLLKPFQEVQQIMNNSTLAEVESALVNYIKDIEGWADEKTLTLILNTLENPIEEGIEVSTENYRKAGLSVQDSLLFIDSEYVKFDLRKKDPVKYGASAIKKENLNNAILKSAEKLKLNINVSSMFSITKSEVNEYNRICELKKFIANVNRNSEDGVTCIPNNYAAISAIMDEGIRYVGIAGGVSFHIKKTREDYAGLLLSAVIWPSFPLGLLLFLPPKHESAMYMLVFDLKTNQFVYGDYHYMRLNDLKGTMNSAIFYNVLKLTTYEN